VLVQKVCCAIADYEEASNSTKPKTDLTRNLEKAIWKPPMNGIY
jgi:ribonuclease HI